MLPRRRFLQATAASSIALARPSLGSISGAELPAEQLDRQLSEILQQPVLRLEHLKEPVIIESIELLQTGNTFLLRTRSRAGLEVITVPHQAKMKTLFPILLKSTVPAFIGRDARDLESLLWDVYRHESNYKLQGLALWVCVAAVEMGLLELLSQTGARPMADLFGGARKRDIGVYFASGNRGNTPEVELAYLQSLVEESGAERLSFGLVVE